MKIRVLGSGCKSCKKLYKSTLDAVGALGLDAEVLYVTDMVEIANTGVMHTPIIEVDGVVKTSGKVLNRQEIISIIK